MTRLLLEFQTVTRAFSSDHENATENEQFRALLKESAFALRYAAGAVAKGAMSGEVLDSNGVTIGAWRMVP